MQNPENGFSFYRQAPGEGVYHFYPGDPPSRPAYWFGKTIEDVITWKMRHGEQFKQVATWTDEQGRTVWVFVLTETTPGGEI